MRTSGNAARSPPAPEPQTGSPARRPPDGEEERVAVTSTGPSPGSGSPRPAGATADPRPGGGGGGRAGSGRRPGAAPNSVSRWALWHSRGRDVDLGRLPRRCWALEAASRRQVEPILPRGNSSARRGPEARAHRAPTRGAKRGSLLPTTLRFHEGEKGTEKPSYPSEVTQPGTVVGPGGWERRAEGEWQVAVRAPKVERKDLAGRRASFLAGRVGGQAGPSEDLGAWIPHCLTAWLAPGPDLPGAIQPDRTLPTGGEPPQLLECIEPHPQDRPQEHPETPHRWKQISRFLSLVPAGSGSGGSAQMPPPPGSPPDSNACEPDAGCKRSSCQG